MERSFSSMTWPRFSLMQMLGATGILALVCASLLAPNGVFAAVWHLVTFGLLAAAIMAAVYRSGPTRAFWAGFALFGWLFVGTEKAGMFDMGDVATILVDEALVRGLDDVYLRQASDAGAERIERGWSLYSDARYVNAEADRVFKMLKRWLGHCVFCLLTLVMALLGGTIGSWLYATRSFTDGVAEDHK